ncbi:MAG: oxygenase MpaB family protein [Acidimicrobiales bacterium]
MSASGGSTRSGAPRLGSLDPAMPTPIRRDSILRRVAGEPATALLVQRALVMEVAHPKVAAGVDDHSGFRTHPVSRAWVTADAALRLVFGDTAVARGAVEQIYRTHDHINGTMAPEGDPYSAHDASLLCWVWATLVDTAEVAYTRWVRTFEDDEAEAFYGEMLAMARFLGIPVELLPADRDEFALYLDDVLDSGVLGSTPATHAMARQVLWFRHWSVAPPVVRLERALALATLDRRLLDRLELRPSAADERLGERADNLLRAHYHRLPSWRRALAPAYVALRRPTIGLSRRLAAPMRPLRHGAGATR